jgi:hypothetical protein
MRKILQRLNSGGRHHASSFMSLGSPRNLQNTLLNTHAWQGGRCGIKRNIGLVSRLQAKQGRLSIYSRLAVVLVHGRANDLPVAQLDIGLGDISVEGQTVLHPLVVITVGEVLSAISRWVVSDASGLFKCRRGSTNRAWAPRDSFLAAADTMVC